MMKQKIFMAVVGGFILSLTGFSLLAQTTTAPTQASPGKVKVLKATGLIGPTLAGYLTEHINRARSTEYECIVIELDTPGGLDPSMREIIQSIIKSDVPIVTYVWPEGARAASAGTVILLASHVAAMSPATNVGAAHPVGLQGENVSDKIVNDSVAYIRSLAELRGRNARWAESAVRESKSITAIEALKIDVIDVVADSLTDLLTKIDGRKVMIAGEHRILRTRGSEVEYQKTNWVQDFFQVLGHPEIAYILIIIGIWGLYFELANPGLIFPGVVGGVALILGLLALSVLPVNLAGALLILLALVLFTVELFTPTHGVLTLGGIISFILGSFLLFPASPYGRVPWKLIIAGSGSTAAFFIIVLWLVVKAQRSKVIMGVEDIPGSSGFTQSDLDPLGVVHVQGEQWSAESIEGPIAKGTKIEVVSVQGLTLKVRKLNVCDIHTQQSKENKS